MASRSQTSQTITAQQHAQRAAAALRANQPAKAIPEFEAIVAAEPGNIDAQANLGVLLYFSGKPQPAIEHFRAALQLNPSLPKIQALLGLAEVQASQPDVARVDLNAALHSVDDPKLRKQVGLALVDMEQAQGHLKAASDAVHFLRDAEPQDPEVLYAAYRVDADMASESLLDLSLGAPDSGQMQQAIAHELTRVRDLKGAQAAYQRALVTDPNLVGADYELAEVLHASANPEDRVEAEKEYSKALAKNPNDLLAAIRLGDLYADRNDMDGAAKYYGQVLAVQPKNADASIGMARVLTERGDTAKALPLLQDVIAADPTNVLAHYRLSALYRRMQRSDDAKRELAEYQKLRELKDKLAKVYSTMKIQNPQAGPDPAAPAVSH